jgi:hypothetical protein
MAAALLLVLCGDTEQSRHDGMACHAVARATSRLDRGSRRAAVMSILLSLSGLFQLDAAAGST